MLVEIGKRQLMLPHSEAELQTCLECGSPSCRLVAWIQLAGSVAYV